VGFAFIPATSRRNAASGNPVRPADKADVVLVDERAFLAKNRSRK
jgi:hypothetical protein